MQQLTTVHCADCGSEVQTRRANTKYCKVCRLLRDVKFVKERTKECWGCGVTFAPLNRGDVFCGTCDLVPGHSVTGTCAFCKAQTQLYSDQVSVCLPCLKDPEKRPTVARSLINKQRKLREG
jgi:hypothetical protein